MRDDAAPARLPHVLLVAFEDPSALGGEEFQHGRRFGWGRLDGAHRVEVGEPCRRPVRRPRQHRPFGVLPSLREVGRESLLGGHDGGS